MLTISACSPKYVEPVDDNAATLWIKNDFRNTVPYTMNIYDDSSVCDKVSTVDTAITGIGTAYNPPKTVSIKIPARKDFTFEISVSGYGYCPLFGTFSSKPGAAYMITLNNDLSTCSMSLAELVKQPNGKYKTCPVNDFRKRFGPTGNLDRGRCKPE